MASTKRTNVKYSERDIRSLYAGIMNKKQLIEKDIAIYEKQTGENFPLEFTKRKEDNYDYVNPQHYVQDDGKQTWERMVDEFGLEWTAIFCELNAYKYQDRMGKKPNEDVEREQGKIDWYKKKAEELWKLHKEENKGIGGFFS